MRAALAAGPAQRRSSPLRFGGPARNLKGDRDLELGRGARGSSCSQPWSSRRSRSTARTDSRDRTVGGPATATVRRLRRDDPPVAFPSERQVVTYSTNFAARWSSAREPRRPTSASPPGSRRARAARHRHRQAFPLRRFCSGRFSWPSAVASGGSSRPQLERLVDEAGVVGESARSRVSRPLRTVARLQHRAEMTQGAH